jgi:hypothetical protein
MNSCTNWMWPMPISSASTPTSSSGSANRFTKGLVLTESVNAMMSTKLRRPRSGGKPVDRKANQKKIATQANLGWCAGLKSVSFSFCKPWTSRAFAELERSRICSNSFSRLPKSPTFALGFRIGESERSSI